MPDERRRDEFESAALPFARPLYAAALRMTGRPEDARDVVQETFLRAYRTFDSFVLGTSPKAWLFTILRSVAANRWRSERRRPVTVSLEVWEERFGALASESSGTVGSVEEVRQALDFLPEEFRLAILLVDVEGLTYEEAASALGCPVGTIRSRLARGRRALFVTLRDYAARAGYSRSAP